LCRVIIAIVSLCCIIAAVFCCRHHFRFLQAKLRAEFDKHKDELDFVKARQILEEAEKKFENEKNLQPLICMLWF